MNKYKTLSFFAILFLCISIATIIASIYYLFNLMIIRLFISIFICIPSIVISAFLYAYAGAYKIDETPKPKPDIKGVFVLEDNNNLNLSKPSLKEKQDLFYSYNKDGVFYELKYLYDDVMILGYAFREPINDLKINEDLLLECEKDNQHDSHAVKVSVKRDYGFHHIGYVAKKNRIKEMAYEYLNDKNKRVFAKLVNNDTSDLRMTVAFFKLKKCSDELPVNITTDYISSDISDDYFQISAEYPCIKKFTITVDYDLFIDVKIGDLVDIYCDYDYEKDKEYYDIEINGYTACRASKSVVEAYEDCIDYRAFVTGVSIDEGKMKLKIAMYDVA